jgi:hypothetical protein
MRRSYGIVALSLAVLSVGLFVRSAFATQVQYQSSLELAQSSEVVIRGQVQSVRSYWNDDHSRILTEINIDVVDQHKGRATGQVTVVQMGGVVDTVRMTVAGALSWKRGEDVLLFLEPSLPGRFRVAGFSQGKFKVERDPRDGVEYVRQASLGNAELVGAPKASTIGPQGAAQRPTLDGLLQELRPFLSEGR